MKPKEALVKDNYPGAKIGKGRLSLPAIERLKELARQGWDIEGYTVTKPVQGADVNKPAEVVKAKVANGEKVIADIGDPRYDEREWEAFYREDGKDISVGMREVCVTCRASFTYHFCGKPQYRAEFDRIVDVTFRGRRG